MQIYKNTEKAPKIGFLESTFLDHCFICMDKEQSDGANHITNTRILHDISGLGYIDCIEHQYIQPIIQCFYI